MVSESFERLEVEERPRLRGLEPERTEGVRCIERLLGSVKGEATDLA